MGGGIARLVLAVAVLSGTWRGVEGAECTGSKCCNVVIPKLDVTTTKIVDGFYATCDDSTTCAVCNEGACTLFATWRQYVVCIPTSILQIIIPTDLLSLCPRECNTIDSNLHTFPTSDLLSPSGTIPPTISALTQLQTLSFYETSLSGTNSTSFKGFQIDQLYHFPRFVIAFCDHRRALYLFSHESPYSAFAPRPVLSPTPYIHKVPFQHP